MIMVYILKNLKLWMKSKLMDNMSVIYKRTIIDLRDDKNKELIECDKYIKENHFDFYKESDKCLFLSRRKLDIIMVVYGVKL